MGILFRRVGGGGITNGWKLLLRLENDRVGDRGLGVTGAVRCFRGIMGTGGALPELVTRDPLDGLRNEPVRRPTISDIGLFADVVLERRFPIEIWLRLSPIDKPVVLTGLTGLESSAMLSDADLVI